ncbi:MAG: CotH kinase family protein [Ferruginibacter sp.]
MKKLFVFIAILTCTKGYTLYAQEIFNQSVLHEIHLNFQQQGWYDTLAQYYIDAADGSSRKYLPVKMNIDGVDIKNDAGIRFKGEYSYTGFPGKKKPFRIHFNKIKSSQDYQGIKKINLHNLAGDPSFLREYVSYGLLRSMGIPASRTSFTKLYINNTYWGCYLIVEEPEDNLFLKQNFGSKDGNLIEAAATTRLNWKGNTPSSYPELKLQTDESDSSWSKVIQWIDFFNNNFAYNFQLEFYKLFNAEEYFKILAADVFLNNWDSYANNGRNFFLYDDPVSKKIRWIPWDYNLSMWKNDLALLPKDGNSSYTYKPLIWRISENAMLKQTYFISFCHLLDSSFSKYPVEEKTLAAFNLIKEAVEADTLKFYTNDDFYNNRTETVTVKMLRDNMLRDVSLPGITTLFKNRITMLRQELLSNGCNCDNKTEDNLPALSARVFPNPAVAATTLYLDEYPALRQAVSIKIYNTTGQLIKELQANSIQGKISLDMALLQSGVYYLKIVATGKKAIIPVIKK